MESRPAGPRALSPAGRRSLPGSGSCGRFGSSAHLKDTALPWPPSVRGLPPAPCPLPPAGEHLAEHLPAPPSSPQCLKDAAFFRLCRRKGRMGTGPRTGLGAPTARAATCPAGPLPGWLLIPGQGVPSQCPAESGDRGLGGTCPGQETGRERGSRRSSKPVWSCRGLLLCGQLGWRGP